MKQIVVQGPTEHEHSGTMMLSTGQISVDVKRGGNIRDSGFLDDEDGVSGRESEFPSSRGAVNKPNEPASEDTPTPTDLIGRKLKSKIKD